MHKEQDKAVQYLNELSCKFPKSKLIVGADVSFQFRYKHRTINIVLKNNTVLISVSKLFMFHSTAYTLTKSFTSYSEFRSTVENTISLI